MPDFLNEMRKGTPTSFHAERNLKRNCVWADNTWLCSLRSFFFKILGKRKAETFSIRFLFPTRNCFSHPCLLLDRRAIIRRVGIIGAARGVDHAWISSRQGVEVTGVEIGVGQTSLHPVQLDTDCMYMCWLDCNVYTSTYNFNNWQTTFQEGASEISLNPIFQFCNWNFYDYPDFVYSVETFIHVIDFILMKSF